MGHSHALVAPNEDMSRLNPVLVWLVVMLRVQDGSWPPKVEPEHVMQSMLDVTRGSLANLTYGHLASIDTGLFVALLNRLANTKVPKDFSRGLQGFFDVWDQALQCDCCQLLSVEVNRDLKGVTLISEPRRCCFGACSGTFRVIKTDPTEIRGWADGNIYPFTDLTHRLHGSNYPLHDRMLKSEEWGIDKPLLSALAKAEVSISHFLRYCVVTHALDNVSGMVLTVRGIWDYVTKGDPMSRAPLIDPIIEQAKTWKEEEATPKHEVGCRVLGNDLLSQATLVKLAQAFASAGITRNQVLIYLDTGTRKALPVATSPEQQVMADLSFLNDKTLSFPSVGEHPLLVWLNAAAVNAYPRDEARVFAEAIVELRTVL